MAVLHAGNSVHQVFTHLIFDMLCVYLQMLSITIYVLHIKGKYVIWCQN